MTAMLNPGSTYSSFTNINNNNMVSFPTFSVSSDVEQFLKSASPLATANVLWVSKSGNDSTGARGRFDRPFLTVAAAQTAASSGDVIRTLQGDYSAETIGGKDGVFYDFMEGSIGPTINVTTAITVKGRGLCQRLICTNAGAVMDMPYMNTVASIVCFGGMQTAGNAGTFIVCFGGTQTAGNAGTFIECSGGTQTAGNAGTYIQCNDGTQTIRLTDQSHDGTAVAPIFLGGSGNLNLYGNTSESTESGGTVVSITNNWSGKLFIDGVKLKATTVGTDEATTGITYGTGVTGKVTLKDCTIITAQDGSGTAKSIDAPSAQTVFIQGTLNQTHAADSNITFEGGAVVTNPNFE
jgi:hypothetical protein